jgi:hypothetical protein
MTPPGARALVESRLHIDIREEKTDAGLTGRSGCNNITIALKTAGRSFCGGQVLTAPC